MKISKLFLTLFLFSFSIISFGMTQTSSPAQKNDAQILETLIQINSNEINAAKEAEKRTTNASVKNFAQMMVRDHSKNRQDIKNLATKIKITPEVSAQSKALKQKGEVELKNLKSVLKTNFDKTYMQAMVNGHQEVLNAIDKDFLPRTDNAQLKQLLTATRATVLHHLKVAKDTLSKL